MDFDYYIDAYFCTLQKKINTHVLSGFSTPNPMDMYMELWIFNQWMNDNGLSLYDDLKRGKTDIPEIIMDVEDFRLYVTLQKGFQMILRMLHKDNE